MRKRIAWMLVAALTAAVMTGCGGQGTNTGDNQAAQEADAEGNEAGAAENEAGSEPGGAQIANPWSDAASMEEAAAGAGIKAFTLPTKNFDYGEPSFRYMKDAVDVNYEKDENTVTIRKIRSLDQNTGDGWDYSPEEEAQTLIGDYSEYSANWEETVGRTEVHMKGGSRSSVNLAYWKTNDDEYYYGVLFNPGDEAAGMQTSKMRLVIAQIDVSLRQAGVVDVPQGLRNMMVGEWIDLTSQRAGMEITQGEYLEDSDFIVQISWAGSAYDCSVWEMNVDYNTDTEALTYTNGRHAIVEYNEDGSVKSEDVEWENSTGSFTLRDGKLYWEDSREKDAKNFEFERMYAENVEAKAFLAGVFEKVTSVEPGTAGASLKMAKAAEEVAKFAYDHEIWNMNKKNLDDAVKRAWDQLSGDNKVLFVANFIGENNIAETIDALYNDYASVRGTLEDAGVGEEAKMLSDNKYARLSWSVLRQHLMKIVGGMQ